MEIWVQITDYKNGAYPLENNGSGGLTNKNTYLLQKSIGNKVIVVPHGNNFYKTTPDCSQFILIHKKDCILLQS